MTNKMMLDPSVSSDAGSNPMVDLQDQVAVRQTWVGVIPASQRYYWTQTWQAGECETLLAYEHGEGVEFTSGSDLAAWLLAGDDDLPDV
jgi:hypothetical protein